MTHRIVRTLRLAVPLCVLVVAGLAVRADQDPLRDFVGQFASVQSLHLRAQAVISIEDSRTQPGSGSVEYWEDVGGAEDRYRVSCQTRGLPMLASDMDIAYDGNEYQLWDRRMDLLSLSVEDPARAPVALPNPAYLPLSFIGSFRGSPGQARAGLTTARRAGLLYDLSSVRSLRDGTWVVETVSEGSGSKSQVTLQPFGGMLVPVEIVLFDERGARAGLIELRDYSAAGGLTVARSVSLRAFGPGGSVVMRSELLVDEVEASRPLDAAVFRLVPLERTSIWDSDRGEFIRYVPR